nr:C45 family peptidase [Rhodococcus fascians]
MLTHRIRKHLEVDERDPYTRGGQRGTALGTDLHSSFDMYSRIFATAGIAEDTVRTATGPLGDVISHWLPDQTAEMQGVADGTGLEMWQVLALNARTELLSLASGARPGECSTVVYAPGPVGQGEGPNISPYGIQTWDWHDELRSCWHTHTVKGTKYSTVGLTENGILSKIGMNSAGVGLFFNILGHRADSPTGIPIHLLSAHVLNNAGSTAEAVDLMRSLPIATSSAFTLLDANTATCAELSPNGVSIVDAQRGFLPHTNHFLDNANAAEERTELYSPDSQDRFGLLTSRIERYASPIDADDLVEYLYSDQDQPHLSCYPAPDAVFGTRWATLATVIIEPALRKVQILDCTPLDVRRRQWRVLGLDTPASVSSL